MTRLAPPSQVVQLCVKSRISNSGGIFHDIEEELIDHCNLLKAPKTKASSHHCFFHNVWTKCKNSDTLNSVQKMAPKSNEGL